MRTVTDATDGDLPADLNHKKRDRETLDDDLTAYRIRAACIEAKGVRCLCCRVDFGERYGTMEQGVIHAHHQELLPDGGPRETSPIEDLFPVCPNCHAMLHRSNPPMTVEDLRRRLRD